MNKSKRIYLLAVSSVLVIGLLLPTVLPQTPGAAQWFAPIQGQPAGLMRPLAASLSGSYLGWVELDYAVSGVYSDPLSPPDPGSDPLPVLGSIDLGLQLTQGGTTVEGYVDLDHTLVFTTEHTVGATAFGPMVTGSITGDTFTLESERVSLRSGGQDLMRQFRLTGGAAPGNSRQLVGEYRETVWGYGPQPVTLVGRFTLDWDTAAATDFIFLPQINLSNTP